MPVIETAPKTPADAATELLSWAMNLLPEVLWDRCVRGGRRWSVYGWVPREDGRSDFVLFQYDTYADTFGYTTSSAKHSREFSERINGTARGHRDCERVADVFGDRVANKVPA